MSTRVSAWEVQDSGLVTAPGRFRRLAGRIRHHAAQGDAWPGDIVLEVADGVVRVTDREGAVVGEWREGEVASRLVATGPPVTFVLEVPGGSHLLAAASGPDTAALLAVLAPPTS